MEWNSTLAVLDHNYHWMDTQFYRNMQLRLALSESNLYSREGMFQGIHIYVNLYRDIAIYL
jgi:hypothetical protein